MKAKMKMALRIAIMLIGIITSIWLSFWVLLVGGIEQAIIGFQTANAGMAALGIVRALICELGFLPLWFAYAFVIYW